MKAPLTHVHALAAPCCLLALTSWGCSERCKDTSRLDVEHMERVDVTTRKTCTGASACDFSSTSEVSLNVATDPCFDGDVAAELDDTAARTRGARSSETFDPRYAETHCSCYGLVVEAPEQNISLVDGLSLRADDVQVSVPATLFPQSMRLDLPNAPVFSEQEELELTWLPVEATPPVVRLELCPGATPEQAECELFALFDTLEMSPGRLVLRLQPRTAPLDPGSYVLGARWQAEREGQCEPALPCFVHAEARMRFAVDME